MEEVDRYELMYLEGKKAGTPAVTVRLLRLKPHDPWHIVEYCGRTILEGFEPQCRAFYAGIVWTLEPAPKTHVRKYAPKVQE